MSLRLLPDTAAATKKQSTPEDVLKVLKGEVYSGIEDRIEALRNEAIKMQAEMGTLLERIDTQGFEVYLDDLKTGKWYRLATEIKTLQEVINVLQALE